MDETVPVDPVPVETDPTETRSAETESGPDAGVERLLRIDAVCLAFDKGWRVGGEPKAEERLSSVEDEAQPELLRELLLIELHYRQKRGEEPTPNEYRDRFPGHADLVATLFSAPPTAPTVTLASAMTGGHLEPAPAGRWPNITGYEILAELGRGGMGVVYKARDVRLNRTVALKMIRDDLASPELRKKFLDEARLTAQLKHPHIVHIQKIDPNYGRPYLDLEYVGGGDLAEKLAGKPMPPKAAAELVVKLARAVEHAHGCKIVHRDLKPKNVLLTESGEPKIADFGLATLHLPGADERSAGKVEGTPAYMAPEQARGDTKNVGKAADVYALGVILFELLTGRVPFVPANGGIPALLERVKAEPPPSPRSLAPTVPKKLDAICLRCLEKNPADRYPSAAALADALDDATRPPIVRAWRRCRRNPVVVLAGLAAVAILVFVVATADHSLRRVAWSGTLRFSIDPDGDPYSTWRGEDVGGIDVDVAREVARRLGVKAEFVENYWNWPKMVKDLDEGTVDALVSCVSITEERKGQVAFVEYARDPFVFTARRGTTVRTREDLRGKQLAVQQGTHAHRAAERFRNEGIPLTIRTFPKVADPFAAVREGNGDVALEHGRISAVHVRKPGPPLESFASDGIDPALADQRLGIAVRKDAHALRDAIEREVRAMEADGTLTGILERWEKKP